MDQVEQIFIGGKKMTNAKEVIDMMEGKPPKKFLKDVLKKLQAKKEKEENRKS